MTRVGKSPGPQNDNKYFEIRSSRIQGRGAFAKRPIKKGTKLIEYVGEVISHEEADRRYPEDRNQRHHTFLFTIDNKRIIDAAYGGNDARFINHSCDPNCISIDYGGEIFIEAKRDIAAGEELAYDYKFERSDNPRDDAWQEELYACRCGAARCRGTILVPRRPAAKKVTAKQSAAKKTTAKKTTKTSPSKKPKQRSRR